MNLIIASTIICQHLDNCHTLFIYLEFERINFFWSCLSTLKSTYIKLSNCIPWPLLITSQCKWKYTAPKVSTFMYTCKSPPNLTSTEHSETVMETIEISFLVDSERLIVLNADTERLLREPGGWPNFVVQGEKFRKVYWIKIWARTAYVHGQLK